MNPDDWLRVFEIGMSSPPLSTTRLRRFVQVVIDHRELILESSPTCHEPPTREHRTRDRGIGTLPDEVELFCQE